MKRPLLLAALAAACLLALTATPVFAADTTPPSVPTNLHVTSSTASSISVAWNPSTDDVAVDHYGTFLNGSWIATLPATQTAYTYTGLTCGTTYTLAVRASDAALNKSDFATIAATTQACGGGGTDTQPPTIPGNLHVTGSTTTDATIAWNASSDNVAVDHYGVFRDGNWVATLPASQTSYTATGLQCGGSYQLSVRAADAAGNRSDFANVTATTASCGGTVLFQDDFNGTAGTPPDPAKWWISPWCQNNTNLAATCFNPNNAFQDGQGHLDLRVSPGTMGRDWDGARISTFKEGTKPYTTVYFTAPPPIRIETRMKFGGPAGGLWSTSWQVATDRADNSIELDDNEWRGAYPSQYDCAVHYWPAGSTPLYKLLLTGQDLTAGYHTYTADYYTDHVVFSMDGQQCGELDGTTPESVGLRLDNLVGAPGTWSGQGGPPPSGTYDSLVDWIKVTSLTDTTGSGTTSSDPGGTGSGEDTGGTTTSPDRPYSDASPFNTLVGANPTVLPNSSTIIANSYLGSGPASLRNESAPANDWSHPIYLAKDTDPTYKLVGTGGGVTGMTIHAPAWAKPTGSSDGHMAIVDTDGWEYDLWQAHAPANGQINYSIGYRQRYDGLGIVTQTMKNQDPSLGGGTAAYFGEAAGLITANDLLNGQINHALFLVVQCGATGYVYPAYKGDCQSNSNGPKMGQRYWLDMTDAQIDATGAPGWERTIAKAAHQYGAYMGDTGGAGFGFMMESAEPYLASNTPNPMAQVAQQYGITKDPTWGYVFKFSGKIPWASHLKAITPPAQ